jgi:hypothetical protein
VGAFMDDCFDYTIIATNHVLTTAMKLLIHVIIVSLTLADIKSGSIEVQVYNSNHSVTSLSAVIRELDT